MIEKARVACKFPHQIGAGDGHEGAPDEFIFARVFRHGGKRDRLEHVDHRVQAEGHDESRRAVPYAESRFDAQQRIAEREKNRK